MGQASVSGFDLLMKVVMQRVSQASVTIENDRREIGRGLVLLVGFTHGDDDRAVDWMARKCVELRVFEDEQEKMNLSVGDIGGDILIVSQFTLYGATRKGRRPSFSDAAPPERSIPLYDAFVERVKSLHSSVKTGTFGAQMNVELMNDGPVTFILESPE